MSSENSELISLHVVEDVSFTRRNQMATPKHDEVDESYRFIWMSFLSGTMMVAEIAVGLLTGSLTLLSDAMHMLSDLLALLIGYMAYKFTRSDSGYSLGPGSVRMEIIGALINGCVLLTFCFSLFIEAIHRIFLETEGVRHVRLVLIVGGAGLIVNLLGLCVFGHHAHDHNHSHDHSHHHSHDHNEVVHSHSHTDLHHDSDEKQTHEHGDHHHCDENTASKHSHVNLNMKAVFLHVAADALGSVAVIVSALIMEFVKHPFARLADPLCTILIVVLISRVTFPLVKNSVIILLGNSPDSINLGELRDALCDVDGVEACHELHVWQLTPSKLIGTVHLIMNPEFHVDHTMSVSDEVKMIFHRYGVHCSVIQKEYPNRNIKSAEIKEWRSAPNPCFDPVCGDPLCVQKTCCEAPETNLSEVPLLSDSAQGSAM